MPVSEDLELAPDFILKDSQGHDVRLTDYRGKQNVVLVFNRGFF
jgi:peroxiredoxin